MNKHLTQSLKFFLLLVLALSSGCGPVTAIPSPTLTPAPSQTSSADKTMSPSSPVPFLPTVTPASTRQAITPTQSLASATLEYYSIVTQEPRSECLPPLTNFAFPVGGIRDLGNITPRALTLPPVNWKKQASLPKDFYFNTFGNITVLANGDLWIQGLLNNDVSYFIYRPRKNSEIYLEEVHGQQYKYYVPEKLLQTPDGTLWGLGTEYGYSYEPWETPNVKPLISRYDEGVGQFEYIENTPHDFRAASTVTDAKYDLNGNIWILINNHIERTEITSGLYRFNPDTLRVDFFLVMPDNVIFRSIMPASDKSIWLLGYESTLQQKTVISRYFPETGELRTYQNEGFLNMDLGSSSLLFLDRSNRLWISNEGWFNNPSSETPAWYHIIQSPIFIDENVDGIGNFYRSRPLGMNQSSDGMFWFWSSIGTVRLNPQIGEWCLFTTYTSPVVEDSNHNLWMVADNKLYKYELGQ